MPSSMEMEADTIEMEPITTRKPLITSSQEGKEMYTTEHEKEVEKLEKNDDKNTNKKISSFYPQMGSWQGFKKVKLSTVRPTKRTTRTTTTTTTTTTTKTTTSTTTTLSTTTKSATTADEKKSTNESEDNSKLKVSDGNNKDDHLHTKLAELLDHNTQLVDIIRATLHIQWTLFSKIVSFILPQ